jgi:hypothetical protein
MTEFNGHNPHSEDPTDPSFNLQADDTRKFYQDDDTAPGLFGDDDSLPTADYRGVRTETNPGVTTFKLEPNKISTFVTDSYVSGGVWTLPEGMPHTGSAYIKTHSDERLRLTMVSSSPLTHEVEPQTHKRTTNAVASLFSEVEAESSRQYEGLLQLTRGRLLRSVPGLGISVLDMEVNPNLAERNARLFLSGDIMAIKVSHDHKPQILNPQLIYAPGAVDFVTSKNNGKHMYGLTTLKPGQTLLALTRRAWRHWITYDDESTLDPSQPLMDFVQMLVQSSRGTMAQLHNFIRITDNKQQQQNSRREYGIFTLSANI